ncbi:zinc finger protein 260-like isoform X2 [Anopheles coustani]|nr:zinc finger protein 260-like isoform X2 [Anopheles coustani]
MDEIDDNQPAQPLHEDLGGGYKDLIEEPMSMLPKERLVEIQIEAVEELEIVCAPTKTNEVHYQQEHLLPFVQQVREDKQVGGIEKSSNGMLHYESTNKSESRIVDEDTKEACQSRLGRETRSAKSASNMKVPTEKIDRIPNKCFICDTVFATVTELQSHLYDHEKILPYRCDKCSTAEHPIEIRTIISLNNHLETHRYKLVCNRCPLRFRSYTSWYEHNKKRHSELRSYTCNLCGMNFEVNRKYLKHMNGHRNKQMGRYKCTTCAKVFETSTELKRHEKIHLSQPVFKCPDCTRGFNQEWSLKLHQRRHRQHSEVYRCIQCPGKYANFTDWRRHMKEHFPEDERYWELQDVLPASLQDAGEYPKGCAEPGCTYVASSLQLMWMHYRTHYKAFECQHCPRKFSNTTNLRQHIDLVHRGLRPHECGKCGKRFGYRHKLKEHMNMHDGVRNLQCRYCEKSFTHSSHLTVHERVHTGAKLYMCDLCGRRFRTSSAFAKHRSQQDQTTGVHVASTRCVQQQFKQLQQHQPQVDESI